MNHYHAGMFGAHLSVAGGMINALSRARELHMDCVQVFTRNQKQWNPPPLPQVDVDAWLAELQAMRWDRSMGRRHADRVVSHNSYLINLASPDRALWRRSLTAHRRELERCEALHIPLCVGHPGAHRETERSRGEPNDLEGPIGEAERSGLLRIVKALDVIHGELSGYQVRTCLETTVGSGTNLGYRFEHLAFVRAHVREPERIAWCLDTCHVTAAGYDMTSDARAAAVLKRFDSICGLSSLSVIHMNDSQGAIGSRRDRHTHIGDGHCGRGCFRTIVNHPGLRNVPKILETPKGTTKKGSDWDVLNMRRLKRLETPAAKRR